MYKIMFVCHGNICRSPMAELLFKDYVKKMNKEKEFIIDSSALSDEEHGNPVYPPVKSLLRKLGISADGKYAKLLTKKDYDNFDYLIIMDSSNARLIKYLFPTDKENKIKKLMDFTDIKGDVADPYYSGDYERTYQDIKLGIEALYAYLVKQS